MVVYESVTAEADTHIDHSGGLLKKGSLLVAMINASEFNKIFKAPEPNAEREAKLHSITEDLEDFLPTIDASGIFEYFQPEEWFGNENYGRAMMAAWWLKAHPEALTPDVRTNIAKLLKVGGETFQKEFLFVYPEAQDF
ncbi:hypothetical protein SERLA73DRAFT_187104 [Serpula lacrymans var. lacrymans S7.3]|uniref:Uncharacterized protein n=2 Tax=Serpula lacrymans var. lacrymans TaxID=341189 RepID=F8Q8H8_SERL3|nr:uncharacterized protein SERLADRAFT_476480 [Serpula lacrymans var. lacrymans S7.9]EGN95866.1 hypothetical protein SERLA73DRAFT_187104 [Serpula lacrymans var. lacrymans S7.3]EGO21382.1 hypothetical protein SERLADRAFT_476480 [Serpula lacrymans var. lacrymans S7.9]